MMSNKKIDLNQADVDELETLMGIGRAKAEAIVETRKELGGFSCLSDLMKVPGIGPGVLDQNRTCLTCSPVQSRKSPRKCDRETRSRNCSASRRDVSPSASDITPMKRSLRRHSGNSACAARDAETNVIDNVKEESPSVDAVPMETEEVASRSCVASAGNSNQSMESEPAGSGEDENDSDDDSSEDKSESPFTIRSRIPVREEPSLWMQMNLMKRKSENGFEMRDITGKRPCRCAASDFSNCESSTGCIRLTPSCVRMRIPSKSNPPPGLGQWLKTFQCWSHAERLAALDDLITVCEPTQVRHMMAVIEPQFQRDFISLLPKELALYVLSFLEPRDLLKAAQTCQYWRTLAEDNLLWREKCREESIDDMLVYGRKRSKSSPGVGRSPWKSLYMRQHQIERNWRTGAIRPPKILKGHDDHVITCLEFGGDRIVSGSDDNTLKVWSAVTGKCLRTLVGHTGGVWSSQMSGHTIVSGSTDRTLKVWNADTGQCVHTLYGHTSTVRCMHLYENKVVSGSRDATLRLWDIETGQCLHVLMGHVAAVRCVQYDGRRVVSGAYDYSVKIWDPETETCLHTLQGHTNRVYSLQFDGVHIVSGSLDTSIRVWDVETGNCLHTLIGHQSLTSGMELKDNILVSGNADSTVKVWDIRTGQCLQTLQGPNKHQSAVTCLQFSKKFVITSSDDGTVKIWDLKTGEFLRNLVALDSGGSGGVVWRVRSNNTKLVCAVGSRNGTEETKLLVLDFDAEKLPVKSLKV